MRRTFKRNIRRWFCVMLALVIAVSALPVGPKEVKAAIESYESASDSEVLSMETQNGKEWYLSWFGDNSGFNYGTDTDGSLIMDVSGSVANDLNMRSGVKLGKLQENNPDGYMFYYTKIEAGKNFTLTAKAKVNSWVYEKNESAFGLAAMDRVGEKGKYGGGYRFWNNNYMAYAGSLYALKDSKSGTVECYTMDQDIPNGMKKVRTRIGVGARERVGVTPDNYAKLAIQQDQATIDSDWKTTWASLLPSQGEDNVIGNGYDSAGQPIDGELKELVFTIEKNNTGYFLSYTDADGNTCTQKFYEPDALEVLDENYVYVGFFITRVMDVTFSDITLTEIAPELDEPAEERPITYIEPTYSVKSASVSNTEDYTLQFYSSVKGSLTVTAPNGEKLADAVEIGAGETKEYDTVLALGKNKYTIEITPDANQNLGACKELVSYEKSTITKNVEYNRIYGDVVYVSPDGQSDNIGTKDSPVDIDTALSFTAPGQKIALMGGIYNRSKSLTIRDGVDGTKDKMIYLMAEDKNNRPVIDFGNTSNCFKISGDYWYIQNIDVTGTKSGTHGVEVKGNYCVYDGLNVYNNGGDGMRVKGNNSDASSLWPKGNTILNCTAYGNGTTTNLGDGFVATTSVGEGNVFDGCISYNNTSKGFETISNAKYGSIGSVVFKNCVAYANGYTSEGAKTSIAQGFRLGSEGVSQKHKIVNCIAFDNSGEGFSNGSCPDDIVENCIMYNNIEGNVSLYASQTDWTDLEMHGLISYYKGITPSNEWQKDLISLKGNQLTTEENMAKVYNSTNYFWGSQLSNGEAKANISEAVITDAWFKSVSTGMDYTTHTYATNLVTRNADNTINMNGLLELTDSAITTLTETYACKLQCTPSPVFDLSKCHGSIGKVTEDTTGVIALKNDKLHVGDSKHDNASGEKDNVVSGFGKGKKADDFKNDTLIDYTGMIIYDKDGKEVKGDAKVGTGCKVSYQFYNDGKVIKTDYYVSMVKGDTDGDGDISVKDLKDMLKDMLKIKELGGINKQAALITDESQNNVSVLDMEALLKDMLQIQPIE